MRAVHAVAATVERSARARRFTVPLAASLALLAPAADAFAQAAGQGTSGPPGWFIALPLLVGAVGSGLAWYVWRQWSAARASRAWPTVAGTVVETELTRRTETYREQDRIVTREVYAPRVRYADEVEGRRYESERIRFGTFRESEKGARAILDRYPVGASVQVRYDPANPSAATPETRATLETKTINIGLQLLAVIALLGLALYLAVMLLT